MKKRCIIATALALAALDHEFVVEAIKLSVAASQRA
jgi:hypothetical protein